MKNPQAVRNFVFTITFLLTACGSYKQNIMFRTDSSTKLAENIRTAEQNYVIAPDDILTIEVYTNKGERLVDPNNELTIQTNQANTAVNETPKYLVDRNGLVKLPTIGEIKLQGLTLRQAEQMLEKAYSPAFVDPYVRIQFQNKRVIVLGSPGGQVIPLNNENVKLTEILALAKGIANDGKAHNIRVIREGQMQVIDFSSFEDYVKNDIIMRSGDIVYVEPVRRPFLEGIRDYGSVLSLITSLGTLTIVLIQNTN